MTIPPLTHAEMTRFLHDAASVISKLGNELSSGNNINADLFYEQLSDVIVDLQRVEKQIIKFGLN